MRDQVVHCDPMTSADVHRITVGSVRLKHSQVRPDDIVDIGEVTRLLAIPEDSDGLVCEHLPGEYGDREVWAHPGAIDREVAQGNCRETVDLIKDPAVVLGRKFRNPIGGDRHCGMRFVEGGGTALSRRPMMRRR